MRRQSLRSIIVYVSLALFPVTFYYLSPALVIMGASEGIVNGSLIMFLLMFLVSIFLGRIWCGWVCPGAGASLLSSKFRKRRVAGGRWNNMKYLVFVPWIALIMIFLVNAGGYSSVDPFYQTVFGISILAPGAIFVLVGVWGTIFGLDLGLGKGAFCHYACWMAPFNIAGTNLGDLTGIRRLRLKADKDKCIGCGSCTRICPQGLDVRKMVAKGSMRNDECVLCLSCVDTCPKKVISLGSSSS